LRTVAYADSSKLNDRIAIYAYRTEKVDFRGWVLDRLPLRPGSTIVDVGCGPGHYLRAIAQRRPRGRLIGLDLSAGMAREAAAAAPAAMVLSGDAGALPFTDDTADLVLAAHMLYHVPDAAATIGELRRVLRPDGLLAAITNGQNHQRQVRELLARIVGRDVWGRVFDQWDLDIGEAMLADQFDHVELLPHPGELRVPVAEPIVRYVASTRGMDDERLGDADWDDVLAALETAVVEEIARNGVFTISLDSGLLVAS
jgi:SAM-dependent methyltransferase